MATHLTPDDKARLRKHLAFIPEGVHEAAQCIEGNNPMALLQTLGDMIRDLETLQEITLDIVDNPRGEPG